jgi:hypothetical protein
MLRRRTQYPHTNNSKNFLLRTQMPTMLFLLPLFFSSGTYAQAPPLPGLPGLASDFNPETINTAQVSRIASRFSTFGEGLATSPAFSSVASAIESKAYLLESVLDFNQFVQPGKTMTTESWYKAMPTEFHSWISSVVSEEIRLITDSNDLPASSTSKADKQAASSTTGGGSIAAKTGTSTMGAGTSSGGTATSTTGAGTSSVGAATTTAKANAADLEQLGLFKSAHVVAVGVAGLLLGVLLF